MDMEKAESNALLNLDVNNLRAEGNVEMEETEQEVQAIAQNVDKGEQRVQALTGVTQRLNKIKQALAGVTQRLNKLEGDIKKLEEGNLKLAQMTERNSAAVAFTCHKMILDNAKDGLETGGSDGSWQYHLR